MTWLRISDIEGVMLEEFGEGSPVISIIAGIHGDEREGVVALGEVARQLQGTPVVGTIRLVRVANPPAYQAHSRTSPRDGMNLARVFPGRRDGSVSERIAHVLSEAVIAQSDLLVDLHSAGAEWVMPFFAGFVSVDPSLDTIAMGACSAFGVDYIWRHDAISEGRSLSVARRLGIPALYVEAGGGNQIRQVDLDGYIRGCMQVLTFMGSIVGEVEQRTDVSLVQGGRGDLDNALHAPVPGHLVATVESGRSVSRGDVLFRIVPEIGDDAVEVRAPDDGIVMAMRRATNVLKGETLAVVASR